MGAGFYMMFATSILMYRIAEMDNKPGYIWFGVNLCVAMIMGKLFGLTVAMAVLGFMATFMIMFLINLIKSDGSG